MTSRSLPLAVAALVAAALTSTASADEGHILRCGTGVHAGEAEGLVPLPQGDVFCPLVADPKAIRSFVSYLWGKFPTSEQTLHLGSIGVGDGFALFRLGGPRPGEGLQLGLEAAVFAQFDLDSPSDDLLNADYLVGLPLTYRYAGFSARARVYHQSSHLGDELLLRADSEIQRVNLAFESVELVLSQELGPLRVYAGGEYLVNRKPSTLDPKLVHAGAEVRAGPTRGLRLVAAADVKSTEQQEWKPAVSVRAGVEAAWWRSEGHPPRIWSLLGEYYDGPSPYGQFFLESTRYAGVGFHVQL
ncbi:DUF1207 domain-containing protein [Anaeromyxobacter soli]|uniref:DUF1207 domain-containing protein n=1 Tax=Anaeromyxobacter soli TaxID=2922725 RepID=UPI001FAECA74|nr:DUF1207 domain-containing protein [Anaeromyxobacter sp. SG29]